MKDVTYTLTSQEAIDIANVIGQLPTHSNAHPLFLKLKQQLEAQLNSEEPPAEA